jgi:hypothetical protein
MYLADISASEYLDRNQSNSARAKSIEGGFSLRKNPLAGLPSEDTYSGSAQVVLIGRACGARLSIAGIGGGGNGGDSGMRHEVREVNR